MERGEPTLVPEWLRSTGSGSGGGGSGHLFASSSPHSDSSSSGRGRNRNSKGTSAFDSPRSAFLDRSSSSGSRRSSSNGPAKNAYSSFSRSHRDKDRDRDKERLNFGADSWEHDDPLSIILSGRGEDTLRRSHSMVTRKQGDPSTRKGLVDLKNGSGSSYANGNGLIQKVVLEKDFPSLGSEDRQGVSEIVRVSSPGLSSAAQSLPVGSSSLLGGEGWTSALVDVPNTIGATASGSSSAAQVASTAGPLSSSGTGGLNMAEALTQVPARTRAAPQLSVQTQRREELAIKQSRQLIPVTPSTPKISVLTSEKSKPKTLVRSEVAMGTKNIQQPSTSVHHINQSLLGGVKTEAPKPSHGKLFVLKPGWENGASMSPKDVVSPGNGVNRATNSQVAAPSSPSAPLRSPNKTKFSSGERKPSALNLMSGFSLEKKPSLSQTRSRNDFFNLLKKKNSSSASAAPLESTSVASSPTHEKSCDQKDVVSAPASPQAIKDDAHLTDNGGAHEEVLTFSEEEAAFLRSLGWEENSGEEGLTEEEINAFYEYVKRKPQVNLCRGVQQKLLESHTDSVNGVVSSERCSSDSGSDA